MATPERDEARHYDTIVIGAGISGLACAAKLFEHPSYREGNRLLVVEARDRIGGRIGSVNTNGCRLDTGANWIHGVGTDDNPNPLLRVLPHKRYRELSGSVMFRPSVPQEATSRRASRPASAGDWVELNSSSSLSTPSAADNDQVIPSKNASTLFSALWSMIGSLHEMATTTSAHQAKHTSMLHAVTRSGAFKSAFEDLPKDCHQALSAMPQFLENIEAAPLAAQSAENAEDPRGMSLLEYAIDDFDGEQVFLQDGYTAVIDEVAKQLVDAGTIRLGTELKQIVWDANPIGVKTSAGAFTAKRVVCTLPLGVLQHSQRSHTANSDITPLFKPSLPQDKTEAIISLGFGTLDKIFLVYSRAWWTEEPYISILKKGIILEEVGTEDNVTHNKANSSAEPDSLWGFTDELAGIHIGQDGSSASGVRALSVINLHSLTGFPVLSSFVSCANAVHVESLSDEAAGAIIHRALIRWLGREPPKPVAVHVTRWAQDEHSRGSYSHMITGLSETRHREAFQQPILNQHGGELRFAGEHTSRNHFATVHGALLSGWREAEAILEALADKP